MSAEALGPSDVTGAADALPSAAEAVCESTVRAPVWSTGLRLSGTAPRLSNAVLRPSVVIDPVGVALASARAAEKLAGDSGAWDGPFASAALPGVATAVRASICCDPAGLVVLGAAQIRPADNSGACCLGIAVPVPAGLPTGVSIGKEPALLRAWGDAFGAP